MKRNSKNKPFLSPQVKEMIDHDNERVTIVHCRYYTEAPVGARVWPTTYLVENDGRVRELLHTFNISTTTTMQIYNVYCGYIYFTLMFEPLTDKCTSFHIEEIIPDTNGFISHEISRNKTGVYHIELFAP